MEKKDLGLLGNFPSIVQHHLVVGGTKSNPTVQEVHARHLSHRTDSSTPLMR
jgi:type IV secretory pathway TrbD component